MANFTKFIRLGLTPWLFRRIRAEAKQQKVSVSELVRTSIEKHLGELIWQRVEAMQPRRASLLDTPVVFWTREEEETADRAMQLFRIMTSNKPQIHGKETQHSLPPYATNSSNRMPQQIAESWHRPRNHFPPVAIST
jgi:hypothetical protein